MKFKKIIVLGLLLGCIQASAETQEDISKKTASVYYNAYLDLFRGNITESQFKDRINQPGVMKSKVSSIHMTNAAKEALSEVANDSQKLKEVYQKIKKQKGSVDLNVKDIKQALRGEKRDISRDEYLDILKKVVLLRPEDENTKAELEDIQLKIAQIEEARGAERERKARELDKIIEEFTVIEGGESPFAPEVEQRLAESPKLPDITESELSENDRELLDILSGRKYLEEKLNLEKGASVLDIVKAYEYEISRKPATLEEFNKLPEAEKVRIRELQKSYFEFIRNNQAAFNKEMGAKDPNYAAKMDRRALERDLGLDTGKSNSEITDAYNKLAAEWKKNPAKDDDELNRREQIRVLYEQVRQQKNVYTDKGHDYAQIEREFELIESTPLTKEQEQKIALDYELNRLYAEMREQTKKAFTIDFQELKGVNIDNLFLNKILSLIPQKDVAVFKKFRIKTPTFFEAPELKKGQYGFGVKGSMIFDGAEVTVYVLLVRGLPVLKDGEEVKTADGYVQIDKSQWGISVGIKMPDKWNISSRYPFLAKLDELSLFSPEIIYSNFDYQTTELGSVKKGFNLVAFVNLTGPLQKFESLVQANKPYLIAQGGKMRLNGVIGNSLATSSIGVTIPLYLGVDFDALYKAGKKKRPPSFLRRITTDDIVVSLKGNGEWEARAGVIVYLVSQENPITFGAGLKFKAPLWTFFGEMKGMWDPAFGQEWLALGNAGIEILVNTAMAATTGVPITGFAAQGSFALGKPGDGRVTSSIAGKIAIPISDGFLLDGKLSKASLSDAITLLARMVGRPIEGKMPDIEFNNLQMRIVPVSDYIGTTRYSQGVRISAGMKIGNFGGGINFAISNEDKTIEGGGYILPISNPIFKLTGFKEENPQMSMKIGFVGLLGDSEILGFIPGVSKLKDFPIPASFEMKIDGMLELPWFFGYKGAFNFSVDDQGLFTKGGIKILSSEMNAELRIPFSNFDGFLCRYELERNTMQAIKESVRGYLGSWKSSLLEAAERGRQDLRAKLERKQHEIEDLKRQRARLEESCKEKTKDIKNIFSKEYWKGVKDCMNVAVKAIDEQATKLDKELSNMTLQVSEALRPENVPAVMFDAVSTIVDVATAMEVTKIFGEITGADIRQGKLPRVTIELAFDIFGKRSVYALRDVQFDFKDPKGSSKAIAEAIKQFFKG